MEDVVIPDANMDAVLTILLLHKRREENVTWTIGQWPPMDRDISWHSKINVQTRTVGSLMTTKPLSNAFIQITRSPSAPREKRSRIRGSPRCHLWCIDEAFGYKRIY